MESTKARLRTLLPGLLERFSDFSAKKLNEANTKALVIEPVVKALGWDLLDLAEVEREFRVFDNTIIDYVLSVDKPVLFLEAKAFGVKLDDKAYISQAVNYANNEGVVWCCLTNGRQWRVYKSNEPVPMDRKLLFEVDLGSSSEGEQLPAEVLDQLALLSKQSLTQDILDKYGDSIFTDSRVRDGLAILNRKLPTSYLNLVRDVIEGPMDLKVLRESLSRIEAAAPVRIPKAPSTKKPDKPMAGRLTKPGKKTYDLDHHLSGKPESIRLLYQELHEEVMKLGADVERRSTKYYINYKLKMSFTTVEVQNSKILVYINLPPEEVSSWDESLMRDVKRIGHYGMGDTEFTLTRSDQIAVVLRLVTAGYDRRKGAN